MAFFDIQACPSIFGSATCIVSLWRRDTTLGAEVHNPAEYACVDRMCSLEPGASGPCYPSRASQPPLAQLSGPNPGLWFGGGLET